MAGSSFGKLFRLHTFGESHGPAIGGIVDGCPAGIEFDVNYINSQLKRRRPGQSSISTQRNEGDEVEILSGVMDGLTTGTPIGFIIKNKDQRSDDYDKLKDNYRPSHADYTYEKKFGIRDHRGGGRSSARETACRIVGGAIASLFLKHYKIEVCAFVKQVGPVAVENNYEALDLSLIDSNAVRCPHLQTADKMIEYIEKMKSDGDSAGGVIQCVIKGVPPGLGEPVFDRFNAVLAHAMFSINAVKGFELGSGFEGTRLKGSEHNDVFEKDQNGNVVTLTNNSGGIQGGITNGMPVYFNVAFKPTATIQKAQPTINKEGEKVTVEGKGRHDPCVVPRAVPIVESMAAMVIADFILFSRSSKV